MDAFRYDQFCPIARAAEIVGHRWVFPILRELTIGPQRFTDLRRRLPGIGSSMLRLVFVGRPPFHLTLQRDLMATLRPPLAPTTGRPSDPPECDHGMW